MAGKLEDGMAIITGGSAGVGPGAAKRLVAEGAGAGRRRPSPSLRRSRRRTSSNELRSSSTTFCQRSESVKFRALRYILKHKR